MGKDPFHAARGELNPSGHRKSGFLAPHSGVLIELGDAIARQLNLGAVAVSHPRRRVEPGLIQGHIEMLCCFSPSRAWRPDKLSWSIAMLPKIERIVAPRGGRMGGVLNL